MTLPSWLPVFVGGRRSQRSRPLLTLESLVSYDLWCYKTWASLRGPPYDHDVADIFHAKARDIHPHQMESISSSTILVVGTPILKLSSPLGVILCFPWDATLQCIFKFGKIPTVLFLGRSLATLDFFFKDLTYIRPTYFEIHLGCPSFGPPTLSSTSLTLPFLYNYVGPQLFH